ncbi:MAG: 3-oxoacyl-ACP reductase family protein [bacterium]
MLIGKTALVTGGSRGIGKAIAIALAIAGADVAITYREQADKANAVADEIREIGKRCVVLPLDVTQDAEIKVVLAKVAEEIGAPTIIVNNAGIVRDNYLRFLSRDDWDAVITTNLTGAFLMCKSSLPPMLRAKWGRIINISSDAAYVGDIRRANYSAAKAGLLGLSRALAREVAGQGITVNSVCPGMIETEMTLDMDETRREGLLKGIPRGKFGTPQDVAALVVFLASPQAEYITGQDISVDGGLHMG